MCGVGCPKHDGQCRHRQQNGASSALLHCEKGIQEIEENQGTQNDNACKCLCQEEIEYLLRLSQEYDLEYLADHQRNVGADLPTGLGLSFQEEEETEGDGEVDAQAEAYVVDEDGDFPDVADGVGGPVDGGTDTAEDGAGDESVEDTPHLLVCEGTGCGHHNGRHQQRQFGENIMGGKRPVLGLDEPEKARHEESRENEKLLVGAQVLPLLFPVPLGYPVEQQDKGNQSHREMGQGQGHHQGDGP